MLKVAYARVSTSSGEQLSALDGQRRRLQDEAPDLLLEDVESGLSTSRPNYQQLKSLLSAGQVQEVIATRLDRLGRDAAESDAFVTLCDRSGAVCRTLDDGVLSMKTPEDLLLTRLRGSLNQGESMKIRLRVNKALDAGRKIGRPMRKPCWGYRLRADRLKLELDPEQLPLAQAFLDTLKAEQWRMGAALRQHPKVPLGSCRAVRAWLLNPTLRGAVGYGQKANHTFDQILWDQHPALLSHEDFAAMQAVISRNRSLWGRNSRRQLRALTGLCRCRECGNRLCYIPGRSIPSLRCKGDRCSQFYKGVREEVIIRHLIAELQQRALQLLAASASSGEPPEAALLRQQIAELVERDDPDYAPVLELKQQKLQQLLAQRRSDPALLEKLRDPRWFDLLPYDELTALLQQLVAVVWITKQAPEETQLRL